METKPETKSEEQRIAEIFERSLAAVGDAETRVVVEAIRDSGPIHQVVLTFCPEWLRVLKESGLQGGDAMVGTPSGERRIRAVVNRARTVWMIPIASGPTGYFIPRTVEEVDGFLDRMQREAKSRAISSMLTAKKMRECLGQPQQDVFLGLMEEAAELTKRDEGQAMQLLGVIVRQRLRIEELEGKMARWGRPSNKKRMEGNDNGQTKLI